MVAIMDHNTARSRQGPQRAFLVRIHRVGDELWEALFYLARFPSIVGQRAGSCPCDRGSDVLVLAPEDLLPAFAGWVRWLRLLLGISGPWKSRGLQRQRRFSN